MSMFNIFDIASMGMNAQSVRLNTISSNMANASNVSGDENEVYRSIHPVFSSINLAEQDMLENPYAMGVKIDGIENNQAPLQRKYDPYHPKADADGYVFISNVNIMQEMGDMISASRTYQTNVQILSLTKDALLQTVNLGK